MTNNYRCIDITMDNINKHKCDLQINLQCIKLSRIIYLLESTS